MKVKITPHSNNMGPVFIPSSKSLGHRAILCAALSKGVSHIRNLNFSKDIEATLNAVKELGAEVFCFDDEVIIEGIGDFSHYSNKPVNCNESGSTLRFCIPIFSLSNQKVTFLGSGRLMERPQSVYEQIFHEQGLLFEQNKESLTIQGALKGQEYTIEGNISSQFITGLLMSLPLVEEDSTIHILPPFESRSYVDLTLDMMKQFQVYAYFQDENTLIIPGRQHFSAADVTIEADYSQAAFFAVLGQINAPVCLKGLRKDSLQGDKAIVDLILSMGGRIRYTEEGLISEPSVLHGGIIDLQNCPDLGPILMVLAAFAENETKIIHAHRLRIKESDRIAAMEEELRKFNVDMTSSEDTIWIRPSQIMTPKEAVNGHNDHRIVMSCAIFATKCGQSVTIEDAQAISKSYPDFFKHLSSLGILVEELL